MSDLLLTIHNSTGTDKDKLEVNKFLAQFDEEKQEWYRQIITKSLTIGMQPKSINKAIGYNLIPEFNVMLAQNYFDEVEKLNGDFIVTLKMDGSRNLLIKENGVIKNFTRQGHPVLNLIDIEEEAKLLPDNYVFDGELLLNEELPSKDLFRETMKVVRKDGNKKNVVFYVFDMIPLDEFKQGVSKRDCLTRKTEVQSLIQSLALKWIRNTEILYVGSDKDKVIELLNEVTTQDKEGVMVQTTKGKYQTKRTKDLLKVKKFHTVDLKIRDIIEGDGRNKGRMGAVVVHYKGNEVNVGSGWNDAQREAMFKEQYKYIGKIIEVSYFEESTNSKTGEVSLRFPTFTGRFRDDKTEESYY